MGPIRCSRGQPQLRDCDGCVYQRDSYTQELTRGIQEAIITKTGCYPHMVINLLHRNRLDANRDIIEAADSNTTVETSWRYFHRMTDTAKAVATRQYGKGLYIDMHAHAHSIQRLEIGHAVWKSDLRQSDNHLNSQTVAREHRLCALLLAVECLRIRSFSFTFWLMHWLQAFLDRLAQLAALSSTALP